MAATDKGEAYYWFIAYEVKALWTWCLLYRVEEYNFTPYQKKQQFLKGLLLHLKRLK